LTARALGGMGSQGVAVAVVKPALGASLVHCCMGAVMH